MASACGTGGDSGAIPSVPDASSTPQAVATEPPPSTADSVPIGEETGPSISEDAVISTDDTAAPGEVRALVRRIEVAEVVRYAGFDIAVNDVAFGFDPAGFRVALVTVTLTNHTPRSERLQTAVEIESQGFVAVTDRDMSPEVPSGSSAGGAFSLRLDSTFTFDDAVLYIGRPDRSRAEIPLGSVGELTTRAPEAFTDLGRSADDVSSIRVDTVTVAWDIADPRGQAEVGSAYLHIEYTLDSTVKTSVSKDTISLIDRNGDAIVPVTATIATVDTAPIHLTASFLVADPPGGEYTLRYTERFGQGEVDVPFSIG